MNVAMDVNMNLDIYEYDSYRDFESYKRCSSKNIEISKSSFKKKKIKVSCDNHFVFNFLFLKIELILKIKLIFSFFFFCFYYLLLKNVFKI